MTRSPVSSHGRMRSPGVRSAVVGGLVAVAAPVLALTDLDSDAATRVAAPRGALNPVPARRSLTIGRSVRNRPIRVVVIRGRRPGRAVLVVGCIHGDERAGIGIARRLAAGPGLARGDLWILFDLNPDGVVARSRQNAQGVDLNRNFPRRFRRLGHRGDQQFSGPRPLSEPESRAVARLVSRIRPRVAIWFHQPIGVTDLSGGAPGPERRFARLSGLPLRRLERYPGSALGWENHLLPQSSAFVVELPARLSLGQAKRYAHAVLSAG